jgi:tetratricopeptide (TPR) repeat protein
VVESICEPLQSSHERDRLLSDCYHLRGRLVHLLGERGKVTSNLEAYELEQKALALREPLPNVDRQDMAGNIGQLAIWAMACCKYEESLEWSQKCLDIRLGEFPGQNIENVCVTYQNYGHCYQFMKRYDEALEKFLQATGVIEDHYGDKAPEIEQYVFEFASLSPIETYIL